jgi:hypothetical protein
LAFGLAAGSACGASSTTLVLPTVSAVLVVLELGSAAAAEPVSATSAATHRAFETNELFIAASP